MTAQLALDPGSATLHGLLARQVQHNPDRLALVDGDVRLTYRALDEQSNRLANYLRRYGIGRNDPVGILLEKCHEYIIAATAILKTGGAILHLEPAYPAHFVHEILVDAAPKVVIARRNSQALPAQPVAAQPAAVLTIEDGDWRSADSTPLHSDACGDDLAIIGYSSGSTGKPKGVLVSHRATLYAYDRFWAEIAHIDGKDRFAYTAFMLWDAFSPLVTGHTGYIVPDEVAFDPVRLLDFIAEQRINHTFLTPSLLSTILQTVDAATIRDRLASLNVAWVGGEVMTRPLVDKTLHLLPHLTLINNYGPTECFVITQGRLCPDDDATEVICPVGRVLDGMDVLLLDDAMQPVPDSAVGELYATGPCLADGYLNNPDLTRRKFIPIDGKLYYKTGDSVRRLPDGRLIVLGRRDATVKIRSYNVNLAAIEETLRRHDRVADCVVVAHGEEGEDKQLVAYVIGQNLPTSRELAAYLQQYLPFYMVPRRYMALESWPIHPVSGKLDKSALPHPVREPQPPSAPVTLPPNATRAQQEQAVMTLLKTLLPLDQIGRRDSFFELGLHSLLAAQLASRVRETLRVDVSVVDVYRWDSAEKLVAHLSGAAAQPDIDWQDEATLDPAITAGARRVHFTPDSPAVFLTGATGFLGTFLLAELLRSAPRLKVYCLLRSESRLAALHARLRRFHLWDETFRDRIILLVGDLEKPRFGWSEETFARRAAQMHAVFHAGAWVNMAYAYQQLKATNVDGTREVIRFATCGVAKPLHYISTLGIFPPGPVAHYREDRHIDPLIDRLALGYTQSKWVAEKLMWHAIDRGVPAHIYRVGNLGPDRTTRLANDNDTVMLLLDVCKRMRLAPDRPDWAFEYTPVDFVARGVVQAALSPRPVSRVFHISGRPLIRARDVFAALQQAGLIDRCLPIDLWRANLRDFASVNSDDAFLEQSLQLEEVYLLDDELFDITLFHEQMRRSGLPLPTVDVAYLVNAIRPQFLGAAIR